MDAPKKIGRYEILQEVGRGAMGTVYRGKDPVMNRDVAIKTILSVALASEQGAEFREHFYREARAAGALLHPGIVAVFDVGEHEGAPFLVMEFIDGRTLADAIEKGERPNLERVCEIGEKVAEALGYAHLQGVVHRDIKPDNILLSSREPQRAERPQSVEQPRRAEQPKISDFGVAKLAEAHATITGEIRGTPAFMSPEQFTGAPIDGRSDIFSLGSVLYGIATGEQPFPGKNMTAVFYKIVHTEPVPPRKLNPALPPKLESVILRCLEKEPADRYQSGEELARDLGEVRASMTASALAGSLPHAAMAPQARASSQASAQASAQARARASTTWANKGSLTWISVAVISVAAVTLGWFALRNHAKSNARETAARLAATASPMPPSDGRSSIAPSPDLPPAKQAGVDVEPVPIAPVSPVPSAEKTAKADPPEAPRVSPESFPKNSGTASNTSARPVAVASLARAIPEPVPAAVDFDPKTLDPKQNARLRIDAGQIPPNVSFVVQMNGKIYLQGESGRDTQAQELFVPPGVQEFRVVAKNGVVQKTSNTVSDDFKPKKRSTLKIEWRTQGLSPGSQPQGLSPVTQVVLTLK